MLDKVNGNVSYYIGTGRAFSRAIVLWRLGETRQPLGFGLGRRPHDARDGIFSGDLPFGQAQGISSEGMGTESDRGSSPAALAHLFYLLMVLPLREMRRGAVCHGLVGTIRDIAWRRVCRYL